MNNLFLLLVLFQLKHFLADFPFQTDWMLRKFAPDWSFVWPLLAHSSVHALFTCVLFLCFGASIPVALALAGLNGVVHFGMDRLKAGPRYLGRFKQLSGEQLLWARIPVNGKPNHKSLWGNKLFWWSLGLDQLVHGLTDLACVWLFLR
jgi:hypothetical protein